MSLISDQFSHEVESHLKRRSAGRGNWHKRALDLVVVIPAILFLFPALLLICLGLLIADGRPIFFRHRRIGKDGKSFDCLKFRTMRKNSDEILAYILATDPLRAAEWQATQKLQGDPRVHLLGKYLRITSADELPQFLNVLKGEMSLVGPRPVTQAELAKYESSLSCYLSMKPGVTGLWQVSRRPGMTYEERVDLDVEYFNTRSLRQDLLILCKTVGVVLFATNEG
ncbi:sugar transferase [Rhizobium sp. TH2]|uniref:sugar transferase n=1 Tax=Rhizobium sp. TH2 TaxID=2775403 RepID=UPI002157EEDE|nr:sugar transferase [Rhizobium sp. TH2]UVC07728.1 sugar transferase [Rhizobium sp. TH2]